MVLIICSRRTVLRYVFAALGIVAGIVQLIRILGRDAQ